jgi:hypothetical protein
VRNRLVMFTLHDDDASADMRVGGVCLLSMQPAWGMTKAAAAARVYQGTSGGWLATGDSPVQQGCTFDEKGSHAPAMYNRVLVACSMS